MPAIQKTFSPVDGSVYVERPIATDAQVQQTMENARQAQARHGRSQDCGVGASRRAPCRADDGCAAGHLLEEPR